jgi:hypothetical protein
MRRLSPLILVAVLGAAGCAATKAGKLAEIQTAYAETARTLVNLRTAGRIDDETWPKVKLADAIAFRAIEDYKAGVATRQAVLNAMAELENFLVQGVN